MCARYEVSVIEPVAGRTVHRLRQWHRTQDNDDTRRTIHDCIGSSAINKSANNILSLWKYSNVSTWAIEGLVSFTLHKAHSGWGIEVYLFSNQDFMVPIFSDWHISLTFPVFSFHFPVFFSVFYLMISTNTKIYLTNTLQLKNQGKKLAKIPSLFQYFG